MPEPELVHLGPDDEFTFGCHSGVSCFNHCCRDLNQALTPYDVLRLRRQLQISHSDFFRRFAVLYPGPASGLPVASLRFDAGNEKHCPFVSSDGCRVYAHRPSSCRLYPLVRGLQRSRADGSISEHFALLREGHCQGFDQGQKQNLHQWISSQGLSDYFRMNDMLMEFIALKNQHRPGPLSPEHRQMVQLALYDPEGLRQNALSGKLNGASQDETPGHSEDEEKWLIWGIQWVRRLLFGNAGEHGETR